MPEIPKPRKHNKLAGAYKDLPVRLSEIAEEWPSFEWRHICIHREDPKTGGKCYLAIMGHVMTDIGPEPKHF